MEKSSFIPRSYSKSELAILYSPNITPKAAVRKLNRWIAFKPGLLEQLAANCRKIREQKYLWRVDIVELNKQIGNLMDQNHMLAEIQVHVIVEALGEP